MLPAVDKNFTHSDHDATIELLVNEIKLDLKPVQAQDIFRELERCLASNFDILFEKATKYYFVILIYVTIIPRFRPSVRPRPPSGQS